MSLTPDDIAKIRARARAPKPAPLLTAWQVGDSPHIYSRAYAETGNAAMIVSPAILSDWPWQWHVYPDDNSGECFAGGDSGSKADAMGDAELSFGPWRTK